MYPPGTDVYGNVGKGYATMRMKNGKDFPAGITADNGFFVSGEISADKNTGYKTLSAHYEDQVIELSVSNLYQHSFYKSKLAYRNSGYFYPKPSSYFQNNSKITFSRFI